MKKIVSDSWRALIVLLLICAGYALPWQAYGTTVEPLDLSGLIDRSDLVAEGLVKSSSADYGPAGNSGMIFTFLELEVKNVLKGQAPEKFYIIIPGGTLGGKTLVVPGMPNPGPGDSAVWFLESTGRSRQGLPIYRSLAADLGHAPVVRDPASGMKTVWISSSDKSKKSRMRVRLDDLTVLIKARQANRKAGEDKP